MFLSAPQDESKIELNQTDLSIIQDIDSIVAEQQDALQGVGVPFFEVCIISDATSTKCHKSRPRAFPRTSRNENE